MAERQGTFRLAAAGDLHCRQDQHGRFRELVKMVNGEAEGLVLAGDLTDHGLLDEAKTLAEAFALLRVPCAAVLGNHDFEGGAVRELCKILGEAKIEVLDGDHTIFDRRLGIAGCSPRRFSDAAAAARPPSGRAPGSRPSRPTSGCSPGRRAAPPPTRTRTRTG